MNAVSIPGVACNWSGKEATRPAGRDTAGDTTGEAFGWTGDAARILQSDAAAILAAVPEGPGAAES